MSNKPTSEFNWGLFDAQPIAIKQVTWEHNIYATFPVDPANAKSIARMMVKPVKASKPRPNRKRGADFARFIPEKEAA